MPLFLYTIKDSSRSAMMVIFMSSLWPILANTAFGVAGIKRDYLNVSALLQLSWVKRLWKVILPAAAPAIVAGLRISIGSAWVAIVAAEMLIGGTGVGYFVWNEWNNLQLTSVILPFAYRLCRRCTRYGLRQLGKSVDLQGVNRVVSGSRACQQIFFRA
jgi:nitrate/nitrite transport system permease protein